MRVRAVHEPAFALRRSRREQSFWRQGMTPVPAFPFASHGQPPRRLQQLRSRLLPHLCCSPSPCDALLTGAERLVRALELLARGKLLALGVDALVVVDKVLLRGCQRRSRTNSGHVPSCMGEKAREGAGGDRMERGIKSAGRSPGSGSALLSLSLSRQCGGAYQCLVWFWLGNRALGLARSCRGRTRSQQSGAGRQQGYGVRRGRLAADVRCRSWGQRWDGLGRRSPPPPSPRTHFSSAMVMSGGV